MLTRSTPVTGILQDRSRALLNDFLPPKSIQTFSIDASRLTTLISQEGIRFTFSPFSFQTRTGETVTGNVDLSFRAFSNKSECILSDRMTTCEDRLLETIGHFCLQANQASTPLQLSTPLTVEIPVPPQLSNPLSMQLFLESVASTGTPLAEKVFDWKTVGSKSVKVKKIQRKKYFQFYLTELNWFACSAFLSKKVPRTMVSARCTAPIDDLEELAAYVVFKDWNTVARMYLNGNRFIGVNISSNKAATIVMIGFRQGEWFYGVHAIEKTASQQVMVLLKSVIESQLLEYLRKL